MEKEGCSEHSMTQCFVFVLPVQTATEIDGAGCVQHRSKEGVVCVPKHRHTGGIKGEADKVKLFYRDEKNKNRSIKQV